MTPTSPTTTVDRSTRSAPRAMRSNRSFAVAVAIALLVYSAVSTGSAGMGFQSYGEDGAIGRTGVFESVSLVLGPSSFVLGTAIGMAAAVMACTSLSRMAPEVARALRVLTLVTIVVLAAVTAVAGYVWLRSFVPGADGWERLAMGDVSVPWPLSATVSVDPW